MTSPFDNLPQPTPPDNNGGTDATTPITPVQPTPASGNPSSADSASNRDYQVAPQQLYQVIRTQLTTGATFTLDSENPKTGVFTFHSFDGGQFTASVLAQSPTSSSVHLESPNSPASTHISEFFAALDAQLGVTPPAEKQPDSPSASKSDLVATIFAVLAPKNEQGKPKSKLAIAALVFSALFVISGFTGFDSFGLVLSTTALCLILCGAGFYATRPSGTVGGRLFASSAVLLTVIGLIIGSISVGISAVKHADTSDSSDSYEPEPVACEDYTWPDSALGAMIPAPESTKGEFSYEHEDSFYISVCDTPKEQYNDYVSAVRDKGFTVDYSKTDTTYYANNEAGYHVSITFDEEGKQIMDVSINAPEEDTTDEDSANDTQSSESTTPQNTEQNKTEEQQPSEDQPQSTTQDSDFKAAMDSYESLMNEYVDFMTKYEQEGKPASMLIDYGKILVKYNDAMDKLNSIDESTLTPDEQQYFIEVQNRVNAKLATVAQ